MKRSPIVLCSALFALFAVDFRRQTAEGAKNAERETDQEWTSVKPGLELAFPADHGAHPSFRTEWWYVTGQVTTEDGERFGFQFTVFRRGLDNRKPEPGASPLRARAAFAGHLAVTDVAHGRTLFAERLRRSGAPLAVASETDLDLVLEDWSLRRGPGAGAAAGAPPDRLTLSASDPALAIGLELELVPSKPLVLHGERGYSQKGAEPGNASAYVSWTRLATSGRLTVDGKARSVHGESWFDHEFGSSVLGDETAGWDWFGLQLDDGRELMLFRLRRAPGSSERSGEPASAGTLIEQDGTTRALQREDFSIEVTERWTSPRTHASYPAHWRITLPDADLRLELAPLAADCELAARSTGTTYWEGPVQITGSTSGRGYAELTGYAGSLVPRF